MVRIPDSRAPARASTAALQAPTVEATAGAFGAGIGRALTSLGNTAFDIAVEEQQEQEQEQARNDLSATDSARNQGTLRFGELLAELRDSADPGAVGFSETFRLKAGGLRDRIIAEIHERTPFSADGLQTVTAVLDGQIAALDTRAGAFERESQDAELRARLHLDSDTIVATAGQNPEDLEARLDDIARLGIRGGILGMTADEAGALVRETRERAASNAVLRLATSDKAAARDLLKSGIVKEALGAEGAGRLADEVGRLEDGALAGGDEEAGAARAREERTRFVLDVLRGGAEIDPFNEEHRRQVESYYDEVLLPEIVAASDSGDPERIGLVIQAQVSFIARTGFIPGAIVEQVRRAETLRTTGAILAAADLIDRVREANPAAMDVFGPGGSPLVLAVADNLDSGVKPERAVALARNALFNGSREEQEQRRAEWEREREDFEESNFFALRRPHEIGVNDRKLLPDFLAAVPEAMELEFNRLVRQEFFLGGDLEEAQREAFAALRRVWAASSIGGEAQFMRFAPEAIPGYALSFRTAEENSAWMREHLLADVLALTTGDIPRPIGLFGAGERVRPFRLEVTENGDRSGRPGYLVLVENADGEEEALRCDGGERLVWRPDFAQSPEAGRIREERDRKVARQVEDADQLRAATVAARAADVIMGP